MSEQQTYVLEGGPHDGRRVKTAGAHVLRMPVPRDMDYFRKVIPFRRGPELSMEVAEYVKTGNVYRYDRLIGDAWADMMVSQQAWVEGGPVVRRLVRERLRDVLEDMDRDKEVDRIVWRITPDSASFNCRVRALVGGHRIERGLRERSERREAADAMQRAVG